MRKAELLERIETAHRQLERYIFYFEKNEQGVFSASERPRIIREEMLEPGFYGEWSLKDLLAFLIDYEAHTVALLEGKEGEIPEPLPEPGARWDNILDANQLPFDRQNLDLEELLERFPHSFEGLFARVGACNEKELFKTGVYKWSGAYRAVDYVDLLTVKLYGWIKDLVRKWNKRHIGEGHNKRVILERIRTERRRLKRNLERIAPQDMEERGVVGEWSVKDLLAHLMEWEHMFIGWYLAGQRGEKPEVPAPEYTWSEMDELNEHIYQKHHERPLEEVLLDFDDSYQRVYALVERIPEDEMFIDGSYEWLGKGNLVSYILANTANHYRWAKEKLRAWMKEKGEI